MLSAKFFQKIVCLCLGLFLMSACETTESSRFKENDMRTVTLTLSDLTSNNIATTIADFTWNELDNGDWRFTIEFIAKEGTSVTTDNRPFRNMPITIYYNLPIDQVKTKVGYKPGIKPLKHQKIKVEYLKDEPGLMCKRLGNIKCRDEHGKIVELN